MLEVNFDAFSDSQMASKIWLCEEVERQWAREHPLTLWIFGSWYGLTALTLLVRKRLPLREIHLFDIDETAQEIAKKILNRWTFHNPIVHFHTLDCLKLTSAEEFFQNRSPGLLINTSCEHFPSTQWLKPIPTGSWMALQSTNMPHETHIAKSENLEAFKNQLKPSLELLHADEMHFDYPQLKFHRFLLLGRKL